ncbi:MAG: DedA family protein [Dehalococcoidia bacterium]|nr:MAG: DedA family protein [Dehalococcoidia bacterium]
MIYCLFVSLSSVFVRLRDGLLTRRSVQVAIFVTILASGFLLLLAAHERLAAEDFTRHGYLGVFVVNMVTCASILFPIPGEAINVAAGSMLSPVTVALVATAGATIGEMTAYVAGFYGRKVLMARYAARYAQAQTWMSRYGLFAVFLFALVPMLVFDLIGIVAGSTRYNLGRFAAATFAGRFLRSLLLSYAGYALFPFLPLT